MTRQREIQFVDGKWLAGRGEEFQSTNPATGEIVWRGPSASDEDVASAVASAQRAFAAWRDTPYDIKEAAVRKFADVVKSRESELTQAISAEIGKPLWEARTEVNAVIGKLEPSIEALRDRCQTHRPSGDQSAVTRFVPIGPVGVITPFNFPIHMPNVHIMPSVLAGNTVVAKPSEAAPYAGKLLAECWQQSGIPDGVVNFVFGLGSVGANLVQVRRCEGSSLPAARRRRRWHRAADLPRHLSTATRCRPVTII